MSSSKILTIILQATIGLIYHHSLFSQNVFGCYMSVRLVCRGCLAPSIHPSENQCVAKHGGMVEMYQRLKYYYRTEGQKPSAEIIEGHCKFFVEVMSVCLVCSGCLAPSIHPRENQCLAKHDGMVEIYQSLKITLQLKVNNLHSSGMIIEDHGKLRQ